MNESKPKLIISKGKKPDCDNGSEASSNGDTFFEEQFKKHKCVRSKSEYSLNANDDTDIWTPILGTYRNSDFRFLKRLKINKFLFS